MTIDLLILAGYLILSSFVYGGILSAVMLGIMVFYLVDPYGRGSGMLFPGAGYFAAILLAGLAGIAGKPFYDVMKDIWYVGNAVLPVVLGYMMAQRMTDVRGVLRIFAGAAACVAAVHIWQFVQNPSYLSGSYAEIRANVSAGYFVTALGIAVIVGDRRHRLGVLRTRWLSRTFLALCFLSVTLSFSRTLWIAVATAVGAVLMRDNGGKRLRNAAALAGICVILLWIAGPGETDRLGDGGDTFLGKALNSVQELSMSDKTTMADISAYWRGFESYRALQTYISGSPVEYLVGKGFGTNIDLGMVMTLGDQEFERIPVLHNGYMYLLVKTGALGLAAYVLFLFLTFRTGTLIMDPSKPEMRFCGLMLNALTLIILETTLVISGMFTKAALYQTTLLLGMLLRYAEVGLSNRSGNDPGFTQAGSSRMAMPGFSGQAE